MFGMRKFNVPAFRPVVPFIVGGTAVLYLVNLAQTAMINSDQYKNDPRNPALAAKKNAH